MINYTYSIILAALGLCHSMQAFSSCGTWTWLPRGMWYLSSSTRDRTCVPCTGRWILNPWTTREGPRTYLKCSPTSFDTSGSSGNHRSINTVNTSITPRSFFVPLDSPPQALSDLLSVPLVCSFHDFVYMESDGIYPFL